MGVMGVSTHLLMHPKPNAGVVVTPKLAPSSCCLSCLPLGSVWAAEGTGVAGGYSWCC